MSFESLSRIIAEQQDEIARLRAAVQIGIEGLEDVINRPAIDVDKFIVKIESYRQAADDRKDTILDAAHGAKYGAKAGMEIGMKVGFEVGRASAFEFVGNILKNFKKEYSL